MPLEQDFQVSDPELRAKRADCFLNVILLVVHVHILANAFQGLRIAQSLDQQQHLIWLAVILLGALLVVGLTAWNLFLFAVEARLARIVNGSFIIRRLLGGERAIDTSRGALMIRVRFPSLKPPYLRTGTLFVDHGSVFMLSESMPNYRGLLERLKEYK